MIQRSEDLVAHLDTFLNTVQEVNRPDALTNFTETQLYNQDKFEQEADKKFAELRQLSPIKTRLDPPYEIQVLLYKSNLIPAQGFKFTLVVYWFPTRMREIQVSLDMYNDRGNWKEDIIIDIRLDAVGELILHSSQGHHSRLTTDQVFNLRFLLERYMSFNPKPDQIQQLETIWKQVWTLLLPPVQREDLTHFTEESEYERNIRQAISLWPNLASGPKNIDGDGFVVLQKEIIPLNDDVTVCVRVLWPPAVMATDREDSLVIKFTLLANQLKMMPEIASSYSKKGPQNMVLWGPGLGSFIPWSLEKKFDELFQFVDQQLTVSYITEFLPLIEQNKDKLNQAWDEIWYKILKVDRNDLTNFTEASDLIQQAQQRFGQLVAYSDDPSTITVSGAHVLLCKKNLTNDYFMVMYWVDARYAKPEQPAAIIVWLNNRGLGGSATIEWVQGQELTLISGQTPPLSQVTNFQSFVQFLNDKNLSQDLVQDLQTKMAQSVDFHDQIISTWETMWALLLGVDRGQLLNTIEAKLAQ